MDDLSRRARMAEFLRAAAVTGGIFFAVVQIRQLRQQRLELAAFEWFRWLAEVLEEMHDPDQPPAYDAHRNRKPTSLTPGI